MTKLDLIRVALWRAKAAVNCASTLRDIDAALDAAESIGRCFEAPPLDLPAIAPAEITTPPRANGANGGATVDRPAPAPRGPHNGGVAVPIPAAADIAF